MNPGRKYNFKILLLVADLVALGLALQVAVWLRYDLGLAVFEPGQKPWDQLIAALPYGLVIWGFSLWTSGTYRLGLGPLSEALRVGRAIGMAFLLLMAATFLYRGFSYSRAVVLLMIPLVFSGTLTLRFIVRFLWHQVLQLDPVQGEALVIGTGPVAQHLATELSGNRADFRVAGILSVDGSTDADQTEEGGVPIIGTLVQLDELLAGGRYGAVLVADGELDQERHLEIAECCLRHGCRYQVVPSIFELMLDRVQVNMVGGMPLMGLKANTITGTNSVIKRVFDLLAVSVLLILSSPLFLLSAIVIKLSSPGPILFRQERVGLNGKTFNLLKFRSMHVADDSHVREYAKKWIEDQAASTGDENEQKVFKVKNDPRVFRFGSFIRKFSIDELPQFINVLRGEMSLIGPRPPIPYEVEVYRDWHRRRFETLPGITGLWQVSGRNHLSFDQMVKLDIEYIENWSLGRDLKIVLKTIQVVVAGSGY